MSILVWHDVVQEDQDAPPTNFQLVAADHNQAYEENNVQGMTAEQLAGASFGEAGPAFFNLMTFSSCV